MTTMYARHLGLPETGVHALPARATSLGEILR